MQLININLDDDINIDDELSLAIGNFDGLHLGHQQLLKEAKNSNFKSAVMTFNPHPFEVLKNIKPYYQLTTLEHKKRLINEFNIDYLIVVNFDIKFAELTVLDFINFLSKFKIKRLICGYDFSFGIGGCGSAFDLAKYFDIKVINKFLIDNVRVSSTYIKELLNIGDMKACAKLLGRPYSIIGDVTYGKQIGRTIFFPTANINYSNYYLPQRGVYAVRVKYQDAIYFAMANIGYNPTVDYKDIIKFEVHILDFNQDIYGEELEVIFDYKIRNEQKFKNLNLLKEQLIKDKEEVLKLYKLGR